MSITKTYNTIGGLREALAALDPDAAIFIDNIRPSALSSYRGYYDHLAIERDDSADNPSTAIDQPGEPFDVDLPGWGTYTPGSAEVKIQSPATVGGLVKALDLANGATFEGYKGGQFTMSASSDLWVSQYGCCDRLRITGVEVLPGRVDLVTTEEEW